MPRLNSYFYRLSLSEKGISIIGLLILLALAYALFSAYTFFNPDNTQLRQYTPLYLIDRYSDQQRIDNLEEISTALEGYYARTNEYPGHIGWCGQIVQVYNPEVKNAVAGYFSDRGIPQDPSFRGTNKDYFYAREGRKTYVLMAVLKTEGQGGPEMNYEGCNQWPGDGVYNYQIRVNR